MEEKVSRIQEVLDKIKYGYVGSDKKIYTEEMEDFDYNFPLLYRLQTPLELLESKYGVCWDQVELIRKLLNDVNINSTTYFIYIDDKEKLPSHTFITFYYNDKVYLLEHAWEKYKGLCEYYSIDNLLEDVIDKFRKEHDELSNSLKLYLYRYEKPKKHISCSEFYKYIETQELIYEEGVGYV